MPPVTTTSVTTDNDNIFELPYKKPEIMEDTCTTWCLTTRAALNLQVTLTQTEKKPTLNNLHNANKMLGKISGEANYKKNPFDIRNSINEFVVSTIVSMPQPIELSTIVSLVIELKTYAPLKADEICRSIYAKTLVQESDTIPTKANFKEQLTKLFPGKEKEIEPVLAAYEKCQKQIRVSVLFFGINKLCGTEGDNTQYNTDAIQMALDQANAPEILSDETLLILFKDHIKWRKVILANSPLVEKLLTLDLSSVLGNKLNATKGTKESALTKYFTDIQFTKEISTTDLNVFSKLYFSLIAKDDESVIQKFLSDNKEPADNKKPIVTILAALSQSSKTILFNETSLLYSLAQTELLTPSATQPQPVAELGINAFFGTADKPLCMKTFSTEEIQTIFAGYATVAATQEEQDQKKLVVINLANLTKLRRTEPELIAHLTAHITKYVVQSHLSKEVKDNIIQNFIIFALAQPGAEPKSFSIPNEVQEKPELLQALENALLAIELTDVIQENPKSDETNQTYLTIQKLIPSKLLLDLFIDNSFWSNLILAYDPLYRDLCKSFGQSDLLRRHLEFDLLSVEKQKEILHLYRDCALQLEQRADRELLLKLVFASFSQKAVQKLVERNYDAPADNIANVLSKLADAERLKLFDETPLLAYLADTHFFDDSNIFQKLGLPHLLQLDEKRVEDFCTRRLPGRALAVYESVRLPASDKQLIAQKLTHLFVPTPPANLIPEEIANQLNNIYQSITTAKEITSESAEKITQALLNKLQDNYLTEPTPTLIKLFAALDPKLFDLSLKTLPDRKSPFDLSPITDPELHPLYKHKLVSTLFQDPKFQSIYGRLDTTLSESLQKALFKVYINSTNVSGEEITSTEGPIISQVINELASAADLETLAPILKTEYNNALTHHQLGVQEALKLFMQEKLKHTNGVLGNLSRDILLATPPHLLVQVLSDSSIKLSDRNLRYILTDHFQVQQPQKSKAPSEAMQEQHPSLNWPGRFLEVLYQVLTDKNQAQALLGETLSGENLTLDFNLVKVCTQYYLKYRSTLKSEVNELTKIMQTGTLGDYYSPAQKEAFKAFNYEQRRDFFMTQQEDAGLYYEWFKNLTPLERAQVLEVIDQAHQKLAEEFKSSPDTLSLNEDQAPLSDTRSDEKEQTATASREGSIGESSHSTTNESAVKSSKGRPAAKQSLAATKKDQIIATHAKFRARIEAHNWFNQEGELRRFDPTHLELADKLVDVKHIDKSLNDLLLQCQEGLKDNISLRPELASSLNAAQETHAATIAAVDNFIAAVDSYENLKNNPNSIPDQVAQALEKATQATYAFNKISSEFNPICQKATTSLLNNNLPQNFVSELSDLKESITENYNKVRKIKIYHYLLETTELFLALRHSNPRALTLLLLQRKAQLTFQQTPLSSDSDSDSNLRALKNILLEYTEKLAPQERVKHWSSKDFLEQQTLLTELNNIAEMFKSNPTSSAMALALTPLFTLFATMKKSRNLDANAKTCRNNLAAALVKGMQPSPSSRAVAEEGMQASSPYLEKMVRTIVGNGSPDAKDFQDAIWAAGGQAKVKRIDLVTGLATLISPKKFSSAEIVFYAQTIAAIVTANPHRFAVAALQKPYCDTLINDPDQLQLQDVILVAANALNADEQQSIINEIKTNPRLKEALKRMGLRDDPTFSLLFPQCIASLSTHSSSEVFATAFDHLLESVAGKKFLGDILKTNALVQKNVKDRLTDTDPLELRNSKRIQQIFDLLAPGYLDEYNDKPSTTHAGALRTKMEEVAADEYYAKILKLSHPKFYEQTTGQEASEVFSIALLELLAAPTERELIENETILKKEFLGSPQSSEIFFSYFKEWYDKSKIFKARINILASDLFHSQEEAAQFFAIEMADSVEEGSEHLISDLIVPARSEKIRNDFFYPWLETATLDRKIKLLGMIAVYVSKQGDIKHPLAQMIKKISQTANESTIRGDARIILEQKCLAILADATEAPQKGTLAADLLKQLQMPFDPTLQEQQAERAQLLIRASESNIVSIAEKDDFLSNLARVFKLAAPAATSIDPKEGIRWALMSNALRKYPKTAGTLDIKSKSEQYLTAATQSSALLSEEIVILSRHTCPKSVQFLQLLFLTAMRKPAPAAKAEDADVKKETVAIIPSPSPS